ncbi:hypothetical protein DS745_03030 [Anaerobacillus alkaliphilus]|uniref:Uncharacterized protein n=1 Tax=Anaerobacillus alkaliphilus TaxID=1548597 RepID=A0A4Q0VXA2_9BACI|nr:hypothetical protein [Anaerobacillus alkaliphilus]RXJ04373.1 hypothetical protein DS745_03030 [Anaerobacillus alkaliphilus]
MEIVGKTPHFMVKNFDLGYSELVKFLRCFTNSVEDLLFPYFEVNLENEEKEWKDFIQDRAVCKSDFWSFQGATHKNIYWYRPKTEQELMKIIKNDGMNFITYITPNGNDIEKHEYLIYEVEHVTDDDSNKEYTAMFIDERNTGSFVERVLPKLRNNFSSLQID